MTPYIRRAARRLAIVGILLAWAGPIVEASLSLASAQSWYPGECCAEYDCFNEPVARDLVERVPGGWLLKKEQRVIPFDHARPSPDRQFHICRNEMGKGSIIIPPGRPACLWVPSDEG